MRRAICLLLASLCLLSQGVTAYAQTNPEDTAEYGSILGGRLQAEIPAGMHFYDSQMDINVEHSCYSLTKRDMIYPYSKPNIVFVELFAYSTGDITRDASLLRGEDVYIDDELLVFGPTPAIGNDGIEMLSTEWKFADNYDKEFFRLVLLKLPDNTLIALRLSATREEVAAHADLYGMLDGVVASIALGEKPLMLERHPVTVSNENTVYQTFCPAGYALSIEVTEWSNAVIFFKVPVIGDNKNTLEMYRYFGLELDERFQKPAAREADRAFLQPIEWKYIDPIPGYPQAFRQAYTFINVGIEDDEYDEEFDDAPYLNFNIIARIADPEEWKTMRQIVRNFQHITKEQ